MEIIMSITQRQNKIATTAITRVLQHLILVNGMDPISVNSLAFGLIMKSLEDTTDKRTARDCINAAMNKAWGKPESTKTITEKYALFSQFYHEDEKHMTPERRMERFKQILEEIK